MTPRIVHIITNLSTGGAEMMLLKVVQATRGQFNHHVVSLAEMGTVGPLLEAEGVQVTPLHVPLGGISLGGALTLARLLKELKPDLVQGWMYHANLAASLMKLTGVYRGPLSWSIRFSIHDMKIKLLSRTVIRINAWLSGMPDAIIYNSRQSRAQHERYGFSARRGQVIPNGFDLTRFRPNRDAGLAKRAQLGIGEAPVVGNVARLDPMKDPMNFLAAAVQIAARIPDARFVMAGRNVPQMTEYFPESAPLIEQLGSRLTLLLSQTEVEALVPAFDVFVLGSAFGEAFPNVLGEAMACAVPCVTTDVGDAAYVVGDTGTVVPPRNPAALADAVCAMLALPKAEREWQGARARERVVANFELSQVGAHYADAWQSLLR